MLMLSRLKFPIEPLVEQMLDQLPAKIWTSKNSTFLDPAMGGGQFLVAIQRRLLAAGHSQKNIAGRLFGCEKNVLRVNYAKNNKKLVTDNLWICDAINHDWGQMKFDVILGNPPYQDSTGQNTIYPKFYAAMHPLLKPNGHMLMITPPAILSGLWGLKNPDGIRMPPPLSIERVTMDRRMKEHFPGVGVDICHWYLINQAGDNQSVSVRIEGEDLEISSPLFAKTTFGNIKLVQSILNKCFQFGKNVYQFSTSDHGRSAVSDSKGRDLAVETIAQDGTIRTRPIIWLKPHAHLDRPKLMLPMYGRAAVIDTSHRLVSAAQDKKNSLPGHNVITVLTKSDQQSHNLKLLLESNLCKFFNLATAETRGPYVNFLAHFRGVDLDKSWTDSELFAHFGLDQNEIELIEKSTS